MTLVRHQSWPLLLEETIDRFRLMKFTWGVADCCLFAAECVKATTGVDFAVPYRGRYRSKRGAYKAMKRVAGGGVTEVASHALGKPLPTTMLARRGDVVLVNTEEGPALGICVGAKCAYLGPAGLVFLGLDVAQAAWRV